MKIRLLLLLIALVLAPCALSAYKGSTSLGSVPFYSAIRGQSSIHPSMSADGRTLAYASNSTNLLLSPPNGKYQIYLSNDTGSTSQPFWQPTLVSLNEAGQIANHDCLWPTLSGDGKKITFVSFASNLVPQAATNEWRIYQKDLLSGKVILVSCTSDGTVANGGSDGSSTSYDGRFVCFVSTASNLVGTNDTNGVADIFRKDTVTGELVRCSVTSGGTQANGTSEFFHPRISGDGQRIVFNSRATNLAKNLTGTYQVYLRDLGTGLTTLMSKNRQGRPGNADSLYPSISLNGNVLAFYSAANDLLAVDLNGQPDVFVREVARENIECISVDSSGVQGNDVSNDPWLSGDGRFVTYKSNATNLVPNPGTGRSQAYVYDRVSKAVVRISHNNAGVGSSGDTYFFGPICSSNGQRIAFANNGLNMRNMMNSDWEIFVHDVGLAIKSIAVRPPVIKGNLSTDSSLELTASVTGFGSGSRKGILDAVTRYVPFTFQGDLTNAASIEVKIKAGKLSNYSGKTRFTIRDDDSSVQSSVLTSFISAFRPGTNGWRFGNMKGYPFTATAKGFCVGMSAEASAAFNRGEAIDTTNSPSNELKKQLGDTHKRWNSEWVNFDFPRRQDDHHKTFEDWAQWEFGYLKAAIQNGRVKPLFLFETTLLGFDAHCVVPVALFESNEFHYLTDKVTTKGFTIYFYDPNTLNMGTTDENVYVDGRYDRQEKWLTYRGGWYKYRFFLASSTFD